MSWRIPVGSRAAAAATTTVAAPKMAVGVNLSAPRYYSRQPGPSNLWRGYSYPQNAHPGFEVPNAGQPVTFGADGWPTSDFAAGFMVGPANQDPYTITVQFDGKADVSWKRPYLGSALTATVYNPGTNQSTCTFLYTPTPGSNGPPLINFSNTQKNAAAAINSGIANLYFWKPAEVGNTTLPWSQEGVAWSAAFSCFRTMDIQQTIGDFGTTTWASRQQNICGINQIETLVAIANQCGKDLWMQIPNNATSDWEAGFFAYILANLNGVLHFGYANETWNSHQLQLHFVVSMAAAEVRGAWGNLPWNSPPFSERLITAAARVSGVTTVTLNFACDLVVGEKAILASFGGGTSGGTAITVTGVSGNTFTVADPGTDTTYPLGGGVFYVAQSAVPLSTLRGSDGQTSLLVLAQRWAQRRLVQASQNCRTVVGDANMMTKFRPMLEDMGVDNSGAAELAYVAFLAGLSATRANQLIWAISGAPYFGSDASPWGGEKLSNVSTAVPQAEYEACYAITAAGMKTSTSGGFKLAERQANVMFYQLAGGTAHYEGGPDTNIAMGYANNITLLNMRLGAGSTALGDAHLAFLKDMGMCGVKLHNQYNGDAPDVALFGPSNVNVYGYTDFAENLTPFWQSFSTYTATPATALPSLNPIDSSGVGAATTVDGRLYAGSFDTTAGYPGLYASKCGNAQSKVDYLVTTGAAGVWTCALTYARDWASNSPSVQVYVNGTLAGSVALPTTGTDLSASVIVSLPDLALANGLNAIRIAGSGGGGPLNCEAFKSLQLVRKS